MEIILIIVAVLFIGYVIYTKVFGSGEEGYAQKKAVYKYRNKDYLMTKSENEFFKMLINVAGDRYFVFPQVHLSAILDEKIKGQPWRAAFRHINGKSVDFVLCDKLNLKPTYAVELDDSTHGRNDRQERDIEVERIFQGTDLPLVRFSDFKNLSEDDIAKRFFEAHSGINSKDI